MGDPDMYILDLCHRTCSPNTFWDKTFTDTEHATSTYCYVVFPCNIRLRFGSMSNFIRFHFWGILGVDITLSHAKTTRSLSVAGHFGACKDMIEKHRDFAQL